VSVEGRPVEHGIACSAVPARVTASGVTEAGDMANEDLIRAERVAVGASRGRMRDPLPGRGLHEVADHPIKPRPRGNHPRSGLALGAVPPKRGAVII
jgi:hypothetical protein